MLDMWRYIHARTVVRVMALFEGPCPIAVPGFKPSCTARLNRAAVRRCCSTRSRGHSRHSRKDGRDAPGWRRFRRRWLPRPASYRLMWLPLVEAHPSVPGTGVVVLNLARRTGLQSLPVASGGWVNHLGAAPTIDGAR